MSYARFGWDDSDVYVFGRDVNPMGEVECMACRLTPSARPENLIGYDSFVAAGPAEMIVHLEAHRAAGDVVPDETFDELREVIEHAKHAEDA